MSKNKNCVYYFLIEDTYLCQRSEKEYRVTNILDEICNCKERLDVDNIKSDFDCTDCPYAKEEEKE